MNKKILVIAPHPDDEMLGCGGTLLKHIHNGDEVSWLICTETTEDMGWSEEFRQQRDSEIIKISDLMSFSNTYKLNFPAAKLDEIPTSEIISKMSQVFREFQPNIVYTSHRGDVHSDHKITFDCVNACCKWFRCISVEKLYAYETPSETEFNYKSDQTFYPNTFVDISEYLDKKLEIVQTYKTEIHSFPFPRSIETLEALAKWRGSNSGFSAAEAFQLLIDRSNTI
jgi:LmbE family N-acetylglucosaminyl deacetylase